MRKTDLSIQFETPKKAQHYITGLLKYISDEFDQNGVARGLAEKYFNDSSSKYYQMTANDIVKQWTKTGQRAIFIGNALDDYVGLVTEPEKQPVTLASWSKQVSFSTDADIYRRVDGWNKYWKWLEDNGWEMVGREVPLFYVINGRLVGGRADMIVYNRRLNNITIIDWKTANEIQKDKWTKRAHGPIDGLYQDKATIYGLQVAFYKIALKDILPPELKGATIDTCIVQARSDGEIVRTKNNIKLTDEELVSLLRWCINEDMKKNTVEVMKVVQEPVQANTEEELASSLAELLSKYSWDMSCKTSARVLSKYLLNTLKNYKEAVESL